MELRRRNGYVTQIQMGCKSTVACKNERSQNFKGARPGHDQCKVETYSRENPSVCRQCCQDALCTGNNLNSFWVPGSQWEWSADF